LDMGERPWLGREERGRDHEVFGGGAVAVKAGEGIYGVADRWCLHARAERHNDARELVGGRGGEAPLWPVELIAGDRGGVDLDQRFAGGRLRGRDPLVAKLPGVAEGVQADRVHVRLGHGRTPSRARAAWSAELTRALICPRSR